MTSRKTTLLCGAVALVVSLFLLGIAYAMPRTVPPSTASCAGITGECAAMPMHGYDLSVRPDQVTRFMVFHEGTTNGTLYAYYMNPDGTAVYTEGIGMPIFRPGRYYGRTVDADPLVNWSGTAVFSATIPFSVQNINPGEPGCTSNVWEGQCNHKVYLSQGAESYHVSNTGIYTITQDHEIMRNGTLYATIHYDVPPGTVMKFYLPTPTPTPEGTPAPTVAALGRAGPTTAPSYEVRVRNAPTATPSPTLTATPPPAVHRVYAPLVAR